jgi:hypothetical protein
MFEPAAHTVKSGRTIPGLNTMLQQVVALRGWIALVTRGDLYRISLIDEC